MTNKKMSKKLINAIRDEVDKWFWWEEDNSEDPLLWAVSEEIVLLRAERDKWIAIAQQLAIGAEDYLKDGYTMQLRKGWAVFLEEVTKNDR